MQKSVDSNLESYTFLCKFFPSYFLQGKPKKLNLKAIVSLLKNSFIQEVFIGGGGGGGMNWEFGINKYKLLILYIEWTDNKVLLYSTGNYIYHPGINHNGTEYEKEYMYN